MTKKLDLSRIFHLEIKTLYDIEKQLEITLPKMAKAATNPELKAALTDHWKETKEQSKRLEKIFQIIGAAPRKYKGKTITGLVADGVVKLTADAPDALRDVMIAGAGRDVEHLEMSSYMNAIEEAKGLGLDEVVELLEITLEEEIVASETLKTAFKDNLKLSAEEEESVNKLNGDGLDY